MYDTGRFISRSLLKTIADFEFGDLFGKSRSKFRVDRRVDIDTVCTDACLPAASEFAQDSSCIGRLYNRVGLCKGGERTINSIVDIRVIENDKRSIATSFQRHSNQVENLNITRRKKVKSATHFFKVPAAIVYNNFATRVDPVKLTFLTILFSHISFPTSRTFF